MRWPREQQQDGRGSRTYAARIKVGPTALTVAKMLAELVRLGAERAGAHEGVECHVLAPRHHRVLADVGHRARERKLLRAVHSLGMPIDGIVAQQGATWFENRKSRFRTNLTRQHHSGGCPRPPPHARGARISCDLRRDIVGQTESGKLMPSTRPRFQAPFAVAECRL